MHGHRHVNQAIDECDLLITVGARFDDRATGRTDMFAPNATVIHIDIDPAEIGKNVKVDVPIVGDAKRVLARLVETVAAADRSEWLARIAGWRVAPPPPDFSADEPGISPFKVIAALRAATGGQAIIAADVGQHQMWAAQWGAYEAPDRWISSGGAGTMGFGLPAAMGAQVGRPESEVWAICGDGGVQMSLPELATIAAERLPVRLMILNNGYLGMVRQWQQLFHGSNYAHTPITSPDFVKLAEAYGIVGLRAERPEEVWSVIAQARAVDGPVVVEIRINPEDNVYPMVPPGGANSQMMFQEDPAAVE